MKYSKSLQIYRLRISVTDKQSFEECDKEILARLENHPELDQEEVDKIKREIL